MHSAYHHSYSNIPSLSLEHPITVTQNCSINILVFVRAWTCKNDIFESQCWILRAIQLKTNRLQTRTLKYTIIFKIGVSKECSSTSGFGLYGMTQWLQSTGTYNNTINVSKRMSSRAKLNNWSHEKDSQNCKQCACTFTQTYRDHNSRDELLKGNALVENFHCIELLTRKAVIAANILPISISCS